MNAIVIRNYFEPYPGHNNPLANFSGAPYLHPLDPHDTNNEHLGHSQPPLTCSLIIAPAGLIPGQTVGRCRPLRNR